MHVKVLNLCSDLWVCNIEVNLHEQSMGGRLLGLVMLHYLSSPSRWKETRLANHDY